MALAPVQLFSPDPGFIGDFTKVPVADIFNNVIAARVNRMEQQFAPVEEDDGYDDILPDAPPQRQAFSPLDLFGEAPAEDRGTGMFQAPPERPSAPAYAGPAEEDYNAPTRGRSYADPADFIFESEARRGADGSLRVYQPPSGDGGGAYEIAGITARYQPKEAAELKALIDSGRSGEAEAKAKDFFRQRAAPFTGLTTNRGLQLQLADTVHHRGEGGLRRVLQRAAGSDSKDYGELISVLSGRPDGLDAFDRARRAYEWEEVDRGRESRKKFRKGLENRFNKAAAAARQI
jgi:hypothetical protein